MALSAFDLYSVGIGPSSSHTVGPMRAARQFAERLAATGTLATTSRLRADLFGSLGATGRGHHSDKAVILGFEGEEPSTVDVSRAAARLSDLDSSGQINVLKRKMIHFDLSADLVLHRAVALPAHPNGMKFSAFDGPRLIDQRTYYSVGGGFVVDEDAMARGRIDLDETRVRFPFASAEILLDICEREELSISDLMLANEESWRPRAQVMSGMREIWTVMQECVVRGCRTSGVLPGPLRVPRRAPELHRSLTTSSTRDPMEIMDWVNLYALAVNEENAAGGRVVTAPTNGAAGIIPAVLHYYARFVPGADDEGAVRFLLTAAAIGTIFKINASISGAEVGCQGEVGSACSMAAGALCEVLGGTPAQVENAAEIGIEHNLGLTCDPVGGLVQVPCIERNAIAAVKAINAAKLALHGNGTHKVSLDKAIKTMQETGRDMHAKYKETSQGGLAVNVVEC